MKAKNLRIGNYILNDHEVCDVVRVDQIGRLLGSNEMCVGFYINGGGYSKTSLEEDNQEDPIIKPIPLTEEWLIKLGFGKSEEYEYAIELTAHSQLHYNHHFSNCFISTDRDDLGFPHISHVHQIQNLFFAMNGNELEINENVSACS